ncbi:uncharacterized protein LOC111637313 [Centruroides sculpturatus]|uniref:uncharacterized protein LOC111637313 n=1 Tax=Centruroides sculpturatus TaxID=218467 RepID=UPI000C6CD8FC|nr:uncharacterized protein LOC111637313 [Centruroides sculpturatus]
MSQDKLVYEILEPILQEMEEQLINEFNESFDRIKGTVSETKIIVQKLISQISLTEMTNEMNKMEERLNETVTFYEKKIGTIFKKMKLANERRKKASLSSLKYKTVADYTEYFTK